MAELKLDKKEIKNFDKFKKYHKDCNKPKEPHQGYSFVINQSNGIGVYCAARCDECKRIMDITNYDSW